MWLWVQDFGKASLHTGRMPRKITTEPRHFNCTYSTVEAPGESDDREARRHARIHNSTCSLFKVLEADVVELAPLMRTAGSQALLPKI